MDDYTSSPDMSAAAKLRILDADSIRSLREAMIEALPQQSAARQKLVDIEDQAEPLRAAMRSPQKGRSP